jgi:hypothetical protein
LIFGEKLMPAPADRTHRLIKRLVQLGGILGFEASSEYPIAEKSHLRVDVLWKKTMPPGCPIRDVNIISFEVQYSPSRHSVTHNVFKAEGALHPSRHYVISYSRLSEDYIENALKPHFSKAGLEIINGERAVKDFEYWIETFITSKFLRHSLVEGGKEINDLLSQSKRLSWQEIEKIIHETLPKIERPMVASRLIENHLRLLADNLEASRDRLSWLHKKWTKLTDQGILPHLHQKGTFDTVKNKLDSSAMKLSFFFGYEAWKIYSVRFRGYF